MSITNCRVCGSLVNSSSRICSKCSRETEEKFKKVREYLVRVPDAGVPEVSKETGVSEREILAFLREGRLQAQRLALSALTCKICSEPIEKGRMCTRCAGQIAQGLGSGGRSASSGAQAPRKASIRPPDKTATSRSRMHTLDRHRQRRSD